MSQFLFYLSTLARIFLFKQIKITYFCVFLRTLVYSLKKKKLKLTKHYFNAKNTNYKKVINSTAHK